MIWLLTLLLVSGTPSEQDDIKVDFTATVTRVNLPLNITNNGEPYKDLNLSQLEVTENGVAVKVNSLKAQKVALTVHYLFDLSTSNARNIYQSKKVARDLVKKMDPGDKAKVSFFSSQYKPLTDYTEQKADLMRRMNFLNEVGSTALYDAIDQALDELSQQSGSRVLLLFSDGHDLVSRISEEGLMSKIKNLRIPIVFVRFGVQYTDKPLLRAQTQFIERISQESGGFVIHGLPSGGRKLARQLDRFRNRYMISYDPPGPEDTEQWRSLLVKVATCPSCKLEYRRGYRISNLH